MRFLRVRVPAAFPMARGGIVLGELPVKAKQRISPTFVWWWLLLQYWLWWGLCLPMACCPLDCAKPSQVLALAKLCELLVSGVSFIFVQELRNVALILDS